MRRVLWASVLLLSACGATSTKDRFQIVDDAIPAPLEGKVGDVVRGALVFQEREQGHCLLCHKVDSVEAPFHGDVGPELSGIGSRFSEAQIRLRIANAGYLNPATVMPPYYRLDGLNQVGQTYRGETALTAQQIEDLVVWLASLKDDTT